MFTRGAERRWTDSAPPVTAGHGGGRCGAQTQPRLQSNARMRAGLRTLPYTPAFDLQQAWDGPAGRDRGRRRTAGRYEVAAEWTPRTPRSAWATTCAAPCSSCADLGQRATPQAEWARAAGQPGRGDPVNSEPRTGLSMGSAPPCHKADGHQTRRQDELAPAIAADADRGSTTWSAVLGLYRDDNLRPNSSVEKLATLRPVFR